MTETSRKYLLWGYLSVCLVGIVLCKVYGLQPYALLPGTENLAQPVTWPQALGMLAFAAAFAGSVFFSMPITPLFCIASGYFYGIAEGTALAALAVTGGSLAAFQFFRKTIAPPAGFRQLEVKNLFLVLLLLRCSPWFPSPLINVFCGVFRVRARVFLASTLVGTLPLICVYTLAASALKGRLDMSLLYSPEIIAALVVLSVISLSGLLPPFRAVTHYLQALRMNA